MASPDPVERNSAIDTIMDFLEQFTGSPVDTARSHGESARGPDLDDEDLIEELSEFLHVARHSDSFRFDMRVWFPEDELSEARALAVEVKSSSDGRFFMSGNE